MKAMSSGEGKCSIITLDKKSEERVSKRSSRERNSLLPYPEAFIDTPRPDGRSDPVQGLSGCALGMTPGPRRRGPRDECLSAFFGTRLAPRSTVKRVLISRSAPIQFALP